ncbi:MerR family transcriptional regulator [Aeromicrobium alkaliterrae]|uniref:MerR family transcriptional regulator n=1 Tax=Aeromicrobium alkaliterrae TaxID=302168 RepID=A0ABP4VXG7_9ACTN
MADAASGTGADASPAPHGDFELTIDELAGHVGMTVRNVRAYAGRGILPPPRLEGRTGYYGREHVQRLQLVRELLDRGFTLQAIESSVREARPAVAGHTLDLLRILDEPHDVEPEIMTRAGLAALAGVDRDNRLIDDLAALGLVRWIDDQNVELLQPQIVRIGATVVNLGLDPSTVINLYPLMRAQLRTVADAFVRSVSAEIIDPFLEAGLPESDWDHILAVTEGLLPIASQVTVAILREQLGAAIDDELSVKLEALRLASTPRED